MIEETSKILGALRISLPYLFSRRNKLQEEDDNESVAWVISDIIRIKDTILDLEMKLKEEIKTGWQPIESCPKGIEVLVYVPTYRKKVMVGKWNKGFDAKPIWLIDNQFGFDVGKATKWQHMPKEPE